VKDAARANEADAGNNLRCNSGVITHMQNSKLIREQSKHGRAQADKHVGANSGGAVFDFTFQANHSA
jgi:hypothetical protein